MLFVIIFPNSKSSLLVILKFTISPGIIETLFPFFLKIIESSERLTNEEEKLIENVYQMNYDPNIHGILIQLPLPKHINEANVLNKVFLTKDIDGFHVKNIGNLVLIHLDSGPKLINIKKTITKGIITVL